VQVHASVGKQLSGPSRPTLSRLGASFGYQAGLCFAVELRFVASSRAFLNRLPPRLDKPLAKALYRCDTDLEGSTKLIIRKAG
jgi:hypothetical protein